MDTPSHRLERFSRGPSRRPQRTRACLPLLFLPPTCHAMSVPVMLRITGRLQLDAQTAISLRIPEQVPIIQG